MRGNGVIQQPDEQAAWRLFCCNWMMLALMAAALVLGLALSGLSIAPASAIRPAAIVAAYAAYACYSCYWQRNPDPRVFFILGSTGQVDLDEVRQTVTGPGSGEGLADAFGFSSI